MEFMKNIFLMINIMIVYKNETIYPSHLYPAINSQLLSVYSPPTLEFEFVYPEIYVQGYVNGSIQNLDDLYSKDRSNMNVSVIVTNSSSDNVVFTSWGILEE